MKFTTKQNKKQREEWKRKGNIGNVRRRQGNKMTAVCVWCRRLVPKAGVSKLLLIQACDVDLRGETFSFTHAAKVCIISGERYLSASVLQRSLLLSLSTYNEMLRS